MEVEIFVAGIKFTRNSITQVPLCSFTFGIKSKTVDWFWFSEKGWLFNPLEEHPKIQGKIGYVTPAKTKRGLGKSSRWVQIGKTSLEMTSYVENALRNEPEVIKWLSELKSLSYYIARARRLDSRSPGEQDE